MANLEKATYHKMFYSKDLCNLYLFQSKIIKHGWAPMVGKFYQTITFLNR